MKLSVIMPFHNELQSVGRAVDSVLANSGCVDAIEILLCNDGLICERDIRAVVSYEGNQILTVLPNKYAKGPGGARNTCLDSAIGDLIAFLDSDDYWLPGKISLQLEAIRNGASFVVTSYKFDSGGAQITPPSSIVTPIDIFLSRGIGTSTILLSRELVGRNRFKDIRFSQDIDFWFSLASSPCFRYARILDELVVYSTSGSTKNKWIQLQYFHRVLRINGVTAPTRIRVLSSYIFYGIYYHYIKRIFTVR